MSSKAKKRLWYGIFILFITVFFIYYLFPSDAVKSRISNELGRAYPTLGIQIDKIKPSFPPGLKLNDVSLFHEQVLWFAADQIRVTPGLLSLFLPEMAFSFKCMAFEGIIDGSAGFTKGDSSARHFYVEADLSGIRIEDIPAIGNLTDHTLSAILDGTMSYSNTKAEGETANAELKLTDCLVALATPFFDLGDLQFSDIKADLTMKNRRIEIKKCTLKGSQADGNISGSVRIKEPVEKSELNLTGSIFPHAELIDNLRTVFPLDFLMENRSGKSGIPFRINGTFNKPGFSMK